MKRFVPQGKSISLYKNFIDAINEYPEAKIDENGYLGTIQNYEVQIENHLIQIMNEVGISSTVKTARYSLPFKYEIINKQVRFGLNYNDFDLQIFVRQVLGELLALNVKKIRFYVIGDLIIEKNDFELKYSHTIISKFRYTIHSHF